MLFYADCLKGSFHDLKRYGDIPGLDSMPPDKVLNVLFSADQIEFMAADTPSTQPHNGEVALALNFSDDEPADEIFAQLAAGGQITQPLGDGFWGGRFGMLVDKFGIHWMMKVG